MADGGDIFVIKVSGIMVESTESLMMHEGGRFQGNDYSQLARLAGSAS